MSASDEVAAVLEQFRAGWQALDIERVLACFADEAVVIGTDAGEYWRGLADFADPFRTMGASFSSARYAWAGQPAIVVAGDVAWADGLLDASLLAGGQSVDARMRTTWVLRRGPSGWRVAQAHFSVAPAAPVAEY